MGTPGLADVSVNRTVVPVGQPFEVTALVENPTDSPRSMAVRLSLFEETVDSRNVSVPPNGDATVRFVQRIEAPGEYAVSVNGETVSVAVVEVAAADDPPTLEPPGGASLQDPSTSLASPILAVIVSLLLVLGIGLRMVE